MTLLLREWTQTCALGQKAVAQLQEGMVSLLGQELRAYLSVSLEYFIRFLSGESKD